jgi:hypothetical protein
MIVSYPSWRKYLTGCIEVIHGFGMNKANLAVSSIEFCQCKYCEGKIGICYGSCGGHACIIPLSRPGHRHTASLSISDKVWEARARGSYTYHTFGLVGIDHWLGTVQWVVSCISAIPAFILLHLIMQGIFISPLNTHIYTLYPCTFKSFSAHLTLE